MRWALVVEAVALAAEADRVQAFGHLDEAARRLRRRRAPVGVISGRDRILCKGVEDVGENELLMLLLVMQADLQDAGHLGELGVLTACQQLLHRGIDVSPEFGDARKLGPREETTARARVARAGGDVIRVEQERERVIEHAIARRVRRQQELLEEPGRMGAMPFGRTGLRHRLHHLILGPERRGAALGLRPHVAEGLRPDRPRIVRRTICGGERCDVSVMQVTDDGRRCRGRHAQSRAGGGSRLGRFQERTEFALGSFIIRNQARRGFLASAVILWAAMTTAWARKSLDIVEG
jgi:hypothetical protein